MNDSISFNPQALIFNSPLECGIRSVALLLALYPKFCDLQRLVQYDYLIVHSGDVEDGPPSIHPSTPYRSGELLVRRSLIEQGLELMSKRMVVELIFTNQGIYYSAGEYAVVFLNSITTGYAKMLCERADWIVNHFQNMSDNEIKEYIRIHLSYWGAEFVKESLFYEGED
jgi:hypothetical protein